MKRNLITLMALGMVAAFAVLAQEQPKAPPAPPAPSAPKKPTAEEIAAQLKKKQDALKTAPAAQTTPARTAPTRPTRTAPTTPPAPPSPSLPTVNVQAPPSVPAPTAQTPPSPAANQAVPAVPRPAQPPTLPAIPAGQLAGGQAAPAAAPKPEQPTTIPAGIINLQKMDMEQWLEFYENLTGKTILRPTNLPASQITLRSQTELTREEAIQAFEHVLTLNGLTAVPIGEKFIELVPSTQAFQSGGKFNKSDSSDLPEAAQFVTQIVQLKHVAPSEASEAVKTFARNPAGIIAIDATQTLVIRDYAINVKRMVEVLDEIDKEIPLEVELELIPIRYALVADVASVLGSLTSSGSITPAGTSTASRTGTSSTRRTGTGATGNRGSLGVTSGFGGTGAGGIGGTTGFNPQQRTGTTTIGTPGGAASTVNSFQNNLQRIVQNAARGGNDTPLLGDAKIIPDERSNALIVFGTKQEREMIKKIVKELDIVQPQVLIEAVIVEVNLNNGNDTGVSFGQQRNSFSDNFKSFGGNLTTAPFPSTFNGTNALSQLTSGFSYFGQLGSSWEAALTAVATDSRFEVLSRPRVQASHAYEAEIFVGETRPFPTGSVSFGGQATTQIQNQSIGIRLNVLPLINVDGVVVLDIAQTVDQIGDEIQVDQFLRVPSIVARSATSRITVRNGDTIILGGFITSEKRQTKSGIPGLKDIPGLGRLFSSKADSLVKRELIVLIRPTVLETPEVAAVAATREREKMIDVKKTEADLRAAEEERYRKLEAEMRKQMKKQKN